MTLRARAWTLIVLMVAVVFYLQFLSEVRAVPLRKPLADVPLTLGEWDGRSLSMEEEIVGAAGVEDYLLRTYVDPAGFPVSVYVGYYERQGEGDQIHSPKHCLPGAGWQPVQNDTVEFETPGINAGRTRANRYVIGKGDDRQLVLYWYQSAGRGITSDYAAKMYLVLDSIFRKRSDGALIRFIVPLPKNASIDTHQARAVQFVGQFLPRLAAILPE